jgi:hypothetical protein
MSVIETSSSPRLAEPRYLTPPGPHHSNDAVSHAGWIRARPDCVAGELQAVAEYKLPEHVRPVPLDRFDADEQRIGDLLEECPSATSLSTSSSRAVSICSGIARPNWTRFSQLRIGAFTAPG